MIDITVRPTYAGGTHAVLDTYLTHGQKDADYDDEWRLFYPWDLELRFFHFASPESNLAIVRKELVKKEELARPERFELPTLRFEA